MLTERYTQKVNRVDALFAPVRAIESGKGVMSLNRMGSPESGEFWGWVAGTISEILADDNQLVK
jgi:hypothetical protein